MKEEELKKIISEVCGKPVKQIKDEASLSLDLMMDSMARIELVSLIEEKMGIKIDEREINAKTTVEDIERMSEKKVSELIGEYGEEAKAVSGRVSEHIVLVNGRKVHYLRYGADRENRENGEKGIIEIDSGSEAGMTRRNMGEREEEGKKERIVIGLHGWPGGCTDFLSVFPAIPGDFEMIVPDLPGCGDTEKLPVKHTVVAFADFINDFTIALGFEKFTISSICGTSPVAIKFASLYPSRVEGLIFHYFPYIYPKLVSWKSGIPMMSKAARFKAGIWLLDKIRNNDRIMGKFLVQGLPVEAQKTAKIDIENKKKAYLKGALEYVRSLMHTDLRKEWNSLTMPILIIAAGSDHTLRMKYALPLVSGRENINLITLPGAKHHWDREFKRRQNEEVNKFLNRTYKSNMADKSDRIETQNV